MSGYISNSSGTGDAERLGLYEQMKVASQPSFWSRLKPNEESVLADKHITQFLQKFRTEDGKLNLREAILESNNMINIANDQMRFKFSKRRTENTLKVALATRTILNELKEIKDGKISAEKSNIFKSEFNNSKELAKEAEARHIEKQRNSYVIRG